MNEIHISQGGSLKLKNSELHTISSVLDSLGISKSCIDFSQEIVNFPQSYVGYISLPDRKIIIDSKHKGVSFKHILRIYYFLYNSYVSDLDEPIYDIDSEHTYDIIQSYMHELNMVVKKGLPVEYKTKQDSLRYLKGKIDLVKTSINKKICKKDVFECEFDELSKDIPINQVFYKALQKINDIQGIGKQSLFERYFQDVSEVHKLPSNIELNTNTNYCKKALTLAYMILNDMSIYDSGNQSYGQSLLINFDKVFEEFVKRILTVYSGDYNFTYWDEEQQYALFKYENKEFYKSYIPDMLYGYQDKIYPNTAYCILDMKNKTSRPFDNADVFQMFFYANQLNSKKIILCYPSNCEKENAVLAFNNDTFNIKKIYASYINITGDTAKDFKENICSFINKIKLLL